VVCHAASLRPPLSSVRMLLPTPASTPGRAPVEPFPSSRQRRHSRLQDGQISTSRPLAHPSSSTCSDLLCKSCLASFAGGSPDSDTGVSYDFPGQWSKRRCQCRDVARLAHAAVGAHHGLFPCAVDAQHSCICPLLPRAHDCRDVACLAHTLQWACASWPRAPRGRHTAAYAVPPCTRLTRWHREASGARERSIASHSHEELLPFNCCPALMTPFSPLTARPPPVPSYSRL